VTRIVETGCLLLLLVVVGLRPLICETYTSARSPLTATLGTLEDPQPATTLAFDAAILAVAAAWMVTRAVTPSHRWRRSGLEWGALLVLVAGAISCAVAGNKRLALNATVDWLTLPLLTLLLVQLLRTGWRVRLALAVILATAAVQAYECFNQVLYSFPQTEQFYEQHRDRIWAERGIEPDSAQVELYERRLYSREASGFLAHGNVTAGYLVAAALATAGLAWSRWRSGRVPAGLIGLVALAMAVAVGLTGSKGALAAGLIASAVWCLRNAAGGWIERHPRRTLRIGWAVVLAAGLATVAHGWYHGSLPGSSLDFRWQYWTASSRMIADHALTGVGRENFGRHYLQYKPITSPEEVSNPHNFLVGATAEWGVVGLGGVVLMLIGGSIAATRGPHDGLDTTPSPRSTALCWGVVTGAVIFLARCFLLGTSDPNYLFVSTAIPLIVWAAVFALASPGRADAGHTRDLQRLAIGVNCALLAFLLQDTINFALSVPGAATTFFALLAIPIALRQPAPATVSTPAGGLRTALARWSPAAIACTALLLHVFLLLAPVARCAITLAWARAHASRPTPGPHRAQPVFAAYQGAASLDPLDPTPCAECAAWLFGFAEAAPDPENTLRAAIQQTDRAIARDPLGTSLHRQKLRICRRAYKVTGDTAHLAAAVNHARRVVDLYPQSPEAHADLGLSLLDVARHRPTSEQLAEARHHLQRTLDLDNARPTWEQIRRLPPRRRQQIQQAIEETTRSEP